MLVYLLGHQAKQSQAMATARNQRLTNGRLTKSKRKSQEDDTKVNRPGQSGRPSAWPAPASLAQTASGTPMSNTQVSPALA